MTHTFDPQKVTVMMQCGICLAMYNKPLTLPCLHSFCNECLASHVSATRMPNGTFLCAVCKTSCSVPATGASGFTKSFLLNSLLDAVIPFQAVPGQDETRPPCANHQGQKIDWYCETCHSPECPQCIVESHNGHSHSTISAAVKRFGEDLRDVMKLAEKSVTALDRIASDFALQKTRMENDFHRVIKDVAGIEEKTSSAAAALQSKMEQNWNESREYYIKMRDNVTDSKEKFSELRAFAQDLYEKMHQAPFCTAVQTPKLKYRFLELQEKPVLGLRWISKRKGSKPKSVATQECQTVKLETSTKCEPIEMEDTASLGKPFQKTELERPGGKTISGIAPIYDNVIGVTYCGSNDIWLYYRGGKQFGKMVKVSDADEITGMVVLKESNGEVALVDGKKTLLYLVTVSSDLSIWYAMTRTLFPADSIGRVITDNDKGALVIWKKSEKRCAVLEANGTLLRHVRFDLPDTKVDISVSVISSGYVVVDRANRKLYFLDEGGAVARTVTTWKVAPCVVSTSWRYLLVPESQYKASIVMWTESGYCFAKIGISLIWPCCIHLDESKRLLYVAGSLAHEKVIYTYRFIPGDLSERPVTVRMRTMTLSH